MQPIIRIHDLSKKYCDAETHALHHFSLDIGSGEVFGILGPNGAGKTTLISILCGLMEPSSGKFTIDGLNFDDDEHDLKQIIGVVPQEYALYPTLIGKDLKQKVSESLEFLGLLKFADKRIETFSGGMKRRINLIAGVLHQPKVLFLDEPTVGVDVQSRHAIMEYLERLHAAGTTIIYTSHHMTEAEHFCTRIAIVDRGQIFTEGSPAELIARTDQARDLEDVFIALTGKELRDAL